VPGIDSTPDAIGKTLTVLTGIGVVAHVVSQRVLKGTKAGKAEAEKEEKE